MLAQLRTNTVPSVLVCYAKGQDLANVGRHFATCFTLSSMSAKSGPVTQQTLHLEEASGLALQMASNRAKAAGNSLNC